MNMPEIDPSHRPTSYWPTDAVPHDGVAIAEIVLDSVLGDRIQVVATEADDGSIRLDVRNDEGATVATAKPAVIDQPLSLGELIALIDSADLGDTMESGIVYGLLAYNSLVGTGNASDASFISVESDVYPGLESHYRQQVRAWVMELAHAPTPDRRAG